MAVRKTKEASEVKEEVKKPVRKTSTATKEPAKRTTTKKETTKAASAKKAEEVKEEEMKETIEKNEEVKETVTFQFSGKSYTPEDLLKSCKDVWKYDLNGKEEDIKSIELYVKPEESITYYVINGDVNGSFSI